MSRNRLNSSRPLPKMSRARQRGYLLMELGLVLVISTILLAGTFSKIIDAVDQLNAESTGDYLKEFQGGLNRYIEDNVQALKNGDAVTGFTVPLQPTLTQLKTTGNYLDASFGNTSALGLSFVVQLNKQGSCPGGTDCVITGTIYSTSGYKDLSGQARIDVLAKAFSGLGPDGAMSYADAPAQLRFQGGQTLANPAGNIAGVLAIRVGNGSGLTGLLNPYYRLDGSKKLNGAMDANNNDIKNVGSLQATNVNVNAALGMLGAGAAPGAACGADPIVRKTASGNAMVICSGGIWQLIGSVVTGIGEGVACSSPGQLGSNATGVSFVCNGAVWSSVNTSAALNGACAPDGRLATTVTKEQLVCKNGSYVKLMNLLNKSVEVSRQLVTDGTTVNKPACDAGGTAAYSFQLTQTVVDVSVTPPRQAMYVAATDVGPSWTIKIKVKDNTGAEVSANTYSVSAVMKVECAY
ncbi:type II secretion system protein [Massilia sp. erpn]|uniref:type II secretion system protein n=1 Tax=Massilia sp. erpn TaxID=2738142 RepID=UPI0021020046|nr:hypothetical protein [Massilia sp. erpn]UTY55857.1 hypothetical protein HPQ68_00850 [Massilia sp. erpn]